MNRFKCPACGRYQYTSDEAEECRYCVYIGPLIGPLEFMDPTDMEKTGEEVDEQLIKLLQSDKEELKRWIKRMKYHCNKVNELCIELNEYQKLLKRIESSPKMPIERWTGNEREIICPACKSYICYPEDIKTIDLKYRQFCGACGQKLNWESEVEYDAMCCEDCPCVNYCDGSMIEACMDDWRKRKQKESEVEESEVRN